MLGRYGRVTILGYVYTSYGARAASVVEADIDQYYLCYGVDGIFLDEVSTAAANLAYYQALHDYIHAITSTAIVVANPGTHQDESYLAAADTTIVFEDASGWASYVADSYVTNYPASRFAALIYAEPTVAGMHSNIVSALQRNIGFIYVTDDDLSNPWDSLSTYWEDEVSYVRALRELRVTSLAVSNGNAHLDFTTVTHASFGVTRTTNLTAAQWTTLTNGIPGTGGTTQVVDPDASTRGMQFYRVEIGESE